MHKIWRASAAVLGVVLLLAGCGAGQENVTGEDKNGGQQTEKKVDKEQVRLDLVDPSAYGNAEGLDLEPGTYISVIGKGSDGAYWENVREGAEKAADDINEMLGYKGEDKIKVVYSGPSETGSVDEQVNILDEELARYPSAVAISVIDSQSCDVQFDLAADNGISVVAFDSIGSYKNVMAKVSTNQTAAAQEAAWRLAGIMKNTGEVLILVHDSRSISSQERADAFAEKLKTDHPGIRVGNIYYMDQFPEMKKTIAEEINTGQYARAGEEKAVNTDPDTQLTEDDISDEEVMDYIFAKNPNVTAIYGTSGEAVTAAADNCERLGKDLDIVGFDAVEEETEALSDGRVDGLIVQNPYGMGYASVVACARSILGIGNEAIVDTGYVWMDKDGLKEPELEAMLY